MTDEELRRLFEETRQQIAETRQQVEGMHQQIAGTRQQVEGMRQQIESSAIETRRYVDEQIAQSTTEMRRHFDVNAENMNTKFGLLAEGLQSLDEKLDRETTDIREEMRRGFAETQAMIKFSHAELDQRIDRLESSAH